jgi:hypothetical protein
LIRHAWDRYRGWAAQARTLQAASGRDRTRALAAAAAAAVFGAASASIPSGEGWQDIASLLAILAAFSASLVAILGRDTLSAGSEAKWTQARATAEAIKSECFVAAARAAPYDGADAAQRLDARLAEIEQPAIEARLLPRRDPAERDERRPGEPGAAEAMTLDWYRAHRISEQANYYDRMREEHERMADRLRIAALGAAVLGALLGAAAAGGHARFAPWIGATTTIAAAIAVWGYMDRRSTLACTYGAMAHRLGVLEARARTGSADLPTIVVEAETLLRGEHAAWTKEMGQAPKPAGAGASG